jgi:uroporphyrinogen-III synthase
VILTGVGLRTLVDTLSQTCPPDRLAALLASTTLVARGPKPVAALRQLSLIPQVRAPEPNTSHELLSALDIEAPVGGRRVAVLEYGVANDELVAGLESRGGNVLRVPLYRWALPKDTGPLRDAVSRLAQGSTTSCRPPPSLASPAPSTNRSNDSSWPRSDRFAARPSSNMAFPST